MNQQRNVNLFDLLARTWERPCAVTGAVFNGDASAVAFVGPDGTASLAKVADPESALSRVRISGDLGQNTIRPPTRAPRPLVTTAAFGPGAPPIAAFGSSDFVVGTASGDVVRLAATGETRETIARLAGPVTAIANAPATGVVAMTDGTGLVLRHGSEELVSPAGEGVRITALAFSASGRRLAVSREDGVAILEMDGGWVHWRTIPLPGAPSDFAWSSGGRWIAAPLSSGGFALVDLDGGSIGIVADFPAPVRAISFSGPADAILSPGAFRIAGWSTNRPPIGGDQGGAIVTGRPGLVPVESVAAHPSRPLVAAGYANGQILLALIGTRDELLVKATGSPVTVLAWSPDGRHLAAGCADGAASLVTFPTQLFK